MSAQAPVTQFLSPDIRFADSAAAPPVAGARAAAAIYGAPLERTMSFRGGASAGPAAIREFSWSLESWSPGLGRDLTDLPLLDLGDLPLESGSVEEALATIEQGVAQVAALASLPVMLGGEHTVSLAACRAMRRLYPELVLIQIDAHTDLRDEYEGEALTHATWLYHAASELGGENIIQLGVRSGAREEWPRARDDLLFSHEELRIPEIVRRGLADRPVYLTVDIDVLDPSCAPGTGSPEPGGPTFRELLGFLYGLAGLRVVGLDVVEVAPDLDASGITAVAAAKIVREAVLLFGVGE